MDDDTKALLVELYITHGNRDFRLKDDMLVDALRYNLLQVLTNAGYLNFPQAFERAVSTKAIEYIRNMNNEN